MPKLSRQPFLLPYAEVDASFLEVLEIPLLAGRSLRPSDSEQNGLLIDAALAGYLWRRDNPVGGRFRIRADGPWHTVVGVTDDLKLFALDDRQGAFDVLSPLPADSAGSWWTFSIRSDRGAEALLPMLREIAADLNPGRPIQRLELASDALTRSVQQPRFVLTLMVAFAGLAAVLAIIGIYGVLSYAVSQGTREMGIRVALGAPASRVRGLVLVRGLRLAVAGTVLGLLAASQLSRLIESLLFDVRGTDAVSYGAVAITMLMVCTLACYVPAARATRVDPVEVLKAD